jgi:desulfoferrodoxin-like iron-binding protein
MRKRAFERVQSDVHVNFSFSDVNYTGVVKNLSENGMCISSEKCLPHKSKFAILFPHNEEVLKLPAMVKRSFKKSSLYEAMGVELLNPPIKYLEFVHRFRLKSLQHLKTARQEMKAYYVCSICHHIVFKQAPFYCPICYASIENFENNPEALNMPEDSENLSEMEKKHIPILTISRYSDSFPDRYDVHVKVGEIEHGMEIEDYITFIDVYIEGANIKKRCIGRVGLRCDKFQPSVNLHLQNIDTSIVSVISKCSVHGSWMSSANI